MQQTEKKSRNRIWLLVLLLAVAIAATTVAVVTILGGFQPDDAGAIPLVDPEAEMKPSDSDPVPEEGNGVEEGEEPLQKVPSLSVTDHRKEWSTETQVEIFKSTYENGNRVVTVKSDNGESVVAPGTGNSYTFKLKNTHSAALDYDVAVEVSFSPAEMAVPLNGRIRRYDGRWILGGKESYAPLSAWDGTTDKATLGAGNYCYYTFDWEWPFEGNDAADTQLGDLLLEQDFTFTLTIRTTATESDDPNATGGIAAPQTGDSTRYALWFGLLGGSAVMLVLLVLTRDKKKEREE